MQDARQTVWRDFGDEMLKALADTTRLRHAIIPDPTSEQRYFIDDVLHEAGLYQLWAAASRREGHRVPAQIFEGVLERHVKSLGKAIIRLGHARCDTMWSLPLDNAAVQLLFVPRADPLQPAAQTPRKCPPAENAPSP
jgi:hypothetical protein